MALAGLAIFTGAAMLIYSRLPAGFLPDEDQGAYFVSVRLPDGASMDRTDAATRKIENVIGGIPGGQTYFTLGGLDIATQTSNSNVATIIATLKPWGERTSQDQQLSTPSWRAPRPVSITCRRPSPSPSGCRPFWASAPPAVSSSCWKTALAATPNRSARVADSLVDATRSRPELANVISTFRANVPAYNVNMDLDKLETLGVPVADAYNALQTFLGGLYVNDFNAFGRTWQVLVQAEPQFRSRPADIDHYYVRAGDGDMAPLGTFASIYAYYRPGRGLPLQPLPRDSDSGRPAPAAIRAARRWRPWRNWPPACRPAIGYEWTGTTYQQKLAQGNEPMIFGFASVLVFLFLAALYESWSIPLAVLFSLPLGMFGALLGVYLRDYPYDIYTQIGIVTLIGLAAKNAILIVEFAAREPRAGHVRPRGRARQPRACGCAPS